MNNFATVINCIDGRVQEVINKYIRRTQKVEYVDTITEAGPCKIIFENIEKVIIENIKARLDISINNHNSNFIAIVGHYDCAKVEEQDELQKHFIITSANIVAKWNPNIPVEAIWVNSLFEVESLETITIMKENV